ISRNHRELAWLQDGVVGKGELLDGSWVALANPRARDQRATRHSHLGDAVHVQLKGAVDQVRRCGERGDALNQVIDCDACHGRGPGAGAANGRLGGCGALKDDVGDLIVEEIASNTLWLLASDETPQVSRRRLDEIRGGAIGGDLALGGAGHVEHLDEGKPRRTESDSLHYDLGRVWLPASLGLRWDLSDRLAENSHA